MVHTSLGIFLIQTSHTLTQQFSRDAEEIPTRQLLNILLFIILVINIKG